MITIEKLCKKFGDKTVLDGLSFTVKDGERVAIVGESGCGKTTLLRIISGLCKCDSGKVEGYSPSDVALVFQEARLFPHLTALDNVACVASGRIKDNRKRASDLLEQLGLSDSENLLPRELSGGMQRRVALARAIMSDRQILVLDEPFESLDDKMRVSAREFVKKHSTGKTVILVSHDKNDVEFLCDKQITLKK